MSNPITIEDIAAALGVSKTTVSRAISGKGRIGEATRTRVLEYIEKNNYRPNVVAKGLAQRRTYNIAVVWPGDYIIEDLPFFQKCLVGMSEVTSGYGYDIIVSVVAGDDISSLKRIIENRKVDGVILTRTLVDDKPADYLLESGVPFVAIGDSLNEQIITVDNDIFDACRELTSIIIGKGHTKLALIGGSSNHMVTRNRYGGFVAAFEKAGKKVDESLIFLDQGNEQKLIEIVKHLVAEKVDGVICMDDKLAGHVIGICRYSNIKIPRDIKLASFCNSNTLENAAVSVTSLNFDDRNLGAVATRMLMELIDGESVKSRKLKNYEVIMKESTK
ncbi:LacI family DNA-binding transcriptional regulator [Butyrivibrio sp. VCD2006]|uniref:LacI family DNA-binding transcriptional regulator n=1 Tax=Butyrivibrio sp. VCD2006 TaxID=1280664 RepID=UPI000401EAAC|nr:LacI family DNA-binding transcriptional regulator [Butyrivibrio sp. VCD2006]